MKRSQATRTGAIAAAVIVAAFIVSVPVSAHEGDDPGSAAAEKRTAIQNNTEANERKKAFQEQIETKRKQIQAQIEAKQQDIRQKLTDKRLKTCQERQEKINKVVDGSKTRAQRVLERLQSVETKVHGYYTSKNVTLSNYDALSSAIDEKEAAAVAAVGVTGQTDFSCESDDASKPGRIVSDTLRAQHEALKAYRDSIRDLIKAIRETTKSKETQ